MNTQPEALRLAHLLETHNTRDVQLESANCLRRLYAANIDCMEHFNALMDERNELLEALNTFANADLNESNCASLEVATRRIRSVARSAIAKATGESK